MDLFAISVVSTGFTYILSLHVLVISNCVMFAQLFTDVTRSQCYPTLEGFTFASASAWSISTLEALCFRFRD